MPLTVFVYHRYCLCIQTTFYTRHRALVCADNMYRDLSKCCHKYRFFRTSYAVSQYDFLCDKYCLKMLLQNREFLYPYRTSIMPITVVEKTCKAYRSTCEHSPANSLAQQTKFLVCCCVHIDLRKCRKASAAQNILPYDIC